jgi:hypothetical protein
MEDEVEHAIRTYRQAERDRPLGGVLLTSHDLVASVSQGQQEAAENLLGKAVRAALADDVDRARRLVERAVALGRDEHEEIGAAWWAAEMLAFNAVSDALEESADGDSGWLDAAETVAAEVDPAGAAAWLGALATLGHPRGVEPVSHREARRCRAAAGEVTPETWAESEPVDAADQVEAVLAVVRAVGRFEQLLG